MHLCGPGDSAASVRGLQDTTSTPASDADCILDLLDWLPTVSASTDLQPSSMVLNERSPPYPIDTPELRLAHSTCSGSFLESGCLTDLLEAPEGWQDVPKVWQESSCNPHAQLPSMRSESSSFTEPELKPSIGLSLPPCSTATPGDLYLSTLDSSDPWPDTSLMLDGMMPFDILDDAAQLSDLDSLSDLPAAEHSGPSTAQPPSSLSRETSCTISSISSTLEPAPAVGQRTTRRYKQKTGRPRRYDTYVAPVEEPEGKPLHCPSGLSCDCLLHVLQSLVAHWHFQVHSKGHMPYLCTCLVILLRCQPVSCFDSQMAWTGGRADIWVS